MAYSDRYPNPESRLRAALLPFQAKIKRQANRGKRVEREISGEHLPVGKKRVGAGVYRRAGHAVEEAINVEGKFTSARGGHLHTGSVHPMLNDDYVPLPRGWRKKP